MRRLPSFLLAAVCAALLAAAPAAPAAGAAERKVPFGFLGTMVDGVFTERPATPLGAETRVMVRTGVERVRLALYWSEAQPDPARAPDFSGAERIVAAAARRRLPVMLTIVEAPVWARKDPARRWSPPADPAAYGRFAGRVAARFGSRGTFWTAHPDSCASPCVNSRSGTSPRGSSPGWAPCSGTIRARRTRRITWRCCAPRGRRSSRRIRRRGSCSPRSSASRG